MVFGYGVCSPIPLDCRGAAWIGFGVETLRQPPRIIEGQGGLCPRMRYHLRTLLTVPKREATGAVLLSYEPLLRSIPNATRPSASKPADSTKRIP